MSLAAVSAPIVSSGDTRQDPHARTEVLHDLVMPWDSVKDAGAISLGAPTSLQ